MRNPRFASAMTAIATPISLMRLRDNPSGFGASVILLPLLSVLAVFFFVQFFGHAPVEPGPIHWINVRVEDHVIEMPDENRQSGQNRLVIVNRRRDVDPPTRDPR